MNSNEKYANSFRYFDDWPTLIKNSSGKFKLVLPMRRKDTLPYNNYKIENPNSVDALGNTLAIKYAKKMEWLKDLQSLIIASPDIINKANVLGITPLHAAVIAENIEGVKLLLSKGAIVNSADIRGNSPLHFAAFLGAYDIIALLLEKEASPDQENENGETPFLIFCGSDYKKPPETLLTIIEKPKIKKSATKEYLTTLKLMIKKKADPFKKDKRGNNALHRAAAWGLHTTIRYLCKKYPDLFWQKNAFSTLPINTAVQANRGGYLKDFFQKQIVSDPKSLNDRFIEETNGISTTGDILVRAGHMEMLEKLFDIFKDAPYKQNRTPFAFTPLHTAASIGNEMVIDVYTGKKLNLDALDAFGNTAAHIAVLNKQTTFLAQLASTILDMKLRNEFGSTPLHLAAALKGEDVYKIFSIIFAKCPKAAFIKDSRGDTPLHLACNSGNLEAVKAICEKFPELAKAICDDVNTPLHLASANGFDKIVAYLFKFGVEIDAYNAFRLTPLMLAAQQGHVNALKVLLALNAEIGSADYEGETSFHKAVFNRYIGVIRLLLNKEESRVRLNKISLVELTDFNGNSPLFKFAQGNSDKRHVDEVLDLSILQLFIDAGANFNIQNSQGDTFLHLVCYRGLNHILEDLSKDVKKAKRLNLDFSVVNNQKESLLHKACAGKKLLTVQKLIALVNIDAENEDEVTPLLLCAKHGYAEIALFLWENGASLTHTDKSGQNILHLILSNSSISREMKQLFERIVKANPNLILKKDKKKRTPFHVLAENGHIGILELLLSYLPGESEKYFVKKNSAKQTAYDIAKEKNSELARKIANFSKDCVGSEYRIMLKTKKKRVRGKKKNKTEKKSW